MHDMRILELNNSKPISPRGKVSGTQAMGCGHEVSMFAMATRAETFSITSLQFHRETEKRSAVLNGYGPPQEF